MAAMHNGGVVMPAPVDPVGAMTLLPSRSFAVSPKPSAEWQPFGTALPATFYAAFGKTRFPPTFWGGGQGGAGVKILIGTCVAVWRLLRLRLHAQFC